MLDGSAKNAGVFDLGQVTALVNHLQMGVGHVRFEFFAAGQGHDLVLLAPQNGHGHVGAVQPLVQTGVVQARLPGQQSGGVAVFEADVLVFFRQRNGQHLLGQGLVVKQVACHLLGRPQKNVPWLGIGHAHTGGSAEQHGLDPVWRANGDFHGQPATQ